MFKKRILLIGNDGAVLFGPEPKKGLEREVAISWSVPDFNQQLIAALVKKNQSASVLILFDGTDMAHRKEDNIPKLNPMDRKKFVTRKLNEAFGSYPIRASLEMKPKEKGHESAYLFVAVTETERLDKVVECLLEASVPIAGFGMLPLESKALMGALSDKLLPAKDKKSVWAVLITQNETGGLRQIVTKDGNLVLTRITPPNEAGLAGEGWVDKVIEEFKATEVYITRIGYSKNDGLDVIVTGGEAEKEFFKQKGFMAEGNFACVKPEQILEVLDFKNNILGEGNFGDVIYAAWAIKKKSLLLPLRVPSLFNIMLPRLGARITGGILILAILGLLGFNFTVYQEYSQASEEVEQQSRQKTLLDREYAQESKVFDSSPVKPDIIKSTLAIRDEVEGKSLNVGATLNVLRKALDSDIRLSNLKVEYKEAPKARSNARSRGRDAAEAKDSVLISFDFSLIKDLPLEEKVIRAEQIVNIIKQTFVGYNVTLKTQFADVSRDAGFSGDTVSDKDSVKDKKVGDASIEISGEAIDAAG